MPRIPTSLPRSWPRVRVTYEAVGAVKGEFHGPLDGLEFDQDGAPLIVLSPETLAALQSRAFPDEDISDTILRVASTRH